MPNTTYKIRSVGGALVVTIPQHIARDAPVKAGDEVTFALTGFKRNIVIERVEKRRTGAKK